jgi:hypothetical protein
MPAHDAPEFLVVFSFAFHVMKHSVAIGADRPEVFDPSPRLPSQSTQWYEVVRFREATLKLTIKCLESKSTNLAFIVLGPHLFLGDVSAKFLTYLLAGFPHLSRIAPSVYVAGQYIDRDVIATQLEYRLELPRRFGMVAFG